MSDAEPTTDELRVLKTLADHAFYANVIADADGNFRYVNEYFAHLCGYSPGELIGRSISLVHTPEQLANSRRIMAQARKRGFSDPQENGYLRRDGTEFPLVVSCVSVEDKSGKQTYTAMSAVDPSPIYEAQVAYQALFNEMLDGFAVHQILCDDAGVPIDYRFLDVNPAFERMTGLRAAEIRGRTVHEVLPGTEQSWIDTYGRVALTGEPARFEQYAATLDKYFEVTAFSPRPGEFATIFQDTTESRRAREELRAREEDLERTQRAVRLGSWTWNPATDRTSWTETLFELFGLDPALGSPAFADQRSLWVPASYEALNAASAETLETGVPFELELEIVRGDRERRWLWVRGEATTDAAGKIAGLWGSAQDLTDRKREEAERLRLETELARALRLESVGRLAGSVAHDFNNMLTVILGHAEHILAQVSATDPLREDLEQIRQAADRSADLTRQLLAFARNQPASPSVLDLNSTVDGALTMLRRLIGEPIELVWTPGRQLASVRIDPSQVGQILTNLCINARDAIQGVGSIVIDTGQAVFDEDFCARNPGYLPGSYVRLSVTDSGVGMDAATLGHVFEPFFTTKELGRGTGLGLATIDGIVRQNEGFVSASSTPGVGTTFSVYLPRQDAAPNPMPITTGSIPIGGGAATILLVEDEPAILALATRWLEGQGFDVMAASTPSDALRLAENHPAEIDLLLTDVIMPEMNGRALADELRATRPTIRVLFMSGYTSDVVTGHGTPEGDADFISKPFHLRALAQKVREVLGS